MENSGKKYTQGGPETKCSKVGSQKNRGVVVTRGLLGGGAKLPDERQGCPFKTGG